MTCDPNDPRLTAFVLGELDPAEHAAVETMLGESADCRQAVEEIRLTVGWLTSQLHDESESHARPAEANHRPNVGSRAAATGRRAPLVAQEPRQASGDRRFALARCVGRLPDVCVTRPNRPDESEP